MWTKKSIHEAVEAQRRFFRSGATLDVDWRTEQLRKLKTALILRQDELMAALKARIESIKKGGQV